MIFREELDLEAPPKYPVAGGVSGEHGSPEMGMKIATVASVFSCGTSWSCTFKDGIEFVTSCRHLRLSPGNVLINADEFITVKPNGICTVTHPTRCIIISNGPACGKAFTTYFCVKMTI